uniref:Transcription factor HES-2-like n=1 Tax=Pogona vitticeps TaxID=103695 RepID=A0A6J0UGN4_9SAUR
METAPRNQPEAKSLDKEGASARNSKNPSRLYRRSIKTQIEKRRRARINASLEQLKKLLQQPVDQQDTKAKSHLEKAEILEMTVQQLRQLKQQGMVAVSSFQDGQDFAAGYCHCLKTVHFFLTSASSSPSQDKASQILKHLEETSASIDWKTHKPDSLSMPQSAFLSSSPSLQPAGIPFSDSYTFTVRSRLHPSLVSMLLPQVHVTCIQPASPATTTHIWRPW